MLIFGIEPVDEDGSAYELSLDPLEIVEYRITEQVNISVPVFLEQPSNGEPMAGDDVATTKEDVPVYIPILDNDSDPDGDPLRVELSDPANGTVSFDGEGYLYTPDADFNGPDSFTYTIFDGNGGSDTATVNITVDPVNDDPRAQDDDDFSTPFGTPIEIDPTALLSNDSDVDGDDLTITEVGAPAGGEVALVDGKILFTPADGFSGAASFVYTVADGNGGVDTANVTISVGANGEPMAGDDVATTKEDVPVYIPILDNDSDPDGDPLRVELSDPANGTVSFDGEGYLYTPDADFNGPDSFTYTIFDGNGGSDTATVNITVDPVNDDPAIRSPDAVSVFDDKKRVLTVQAEDPDGDMLAFGILAGDDADLFEIDPISGELSFINQPDFDAPLDAGLDNTYELIVGVSDLAGASATQELSVSVQRAPDSGSSVQIGSWQFEPEAPVQNDAPGNDNPVTFRGGANAADGAVNFDGFNDYLLIENTEAYQLSQGAIRISFCVDELSGVSGGDRLRNDDYQALFSRDARGFEGGGHLSAFVDGDGSILIRHQTEDESYFVRTAAKLVTAGREIELTYVFDDTNGMQLFANIDGAGPRLVGENRIPVDDGVSLNLIGNEEPWTIGASQIRSNKDQANRLSNYFEGKVSGFEIFLGGQPVDTNEAPLILSPNLVTILDDTKDVTKIEAVDPDGDLLDFDIVGGNDADLFMIDPDSGALSFLSQPDFDQPEDTGADNTYEVTVRVTDTGGLSATQELSVVVQDAPDASDIMQIGSWQFSSNEPSANGAPESNNPVLFRGGASSSDGLANLDGINDYLLIQNIPDYRLEEGAIRIIFCVDELTGTSGGDRLRNDDYQALFSRDSRGFDDGGHLSAFVDGDGSIFVRHQTSDTSYTLRTDTGLVEEGNEVEFVYRFDDELGMSLYVDTDRSGLELVAENNSPILDGVNLDLVGNDEPWTIGASQARSNDGVANRLSNYLDGKVDSFDILTSLSDEFVF
nr:Ig-like domain-containing protein [Shimia sp. R9_3]